MQPTERQLGTVWWGTAMAWADQRLIHFCLFNGEGGVRCKMVHIKWTLMDRWSSGWGWGWDWGWLEAVRLVVGQCAHIYMHIKWPDRQLAGRGNSREGKGGVCSVGSICFGCPWSLLGKRLSRQLGRRSDGRSCNWNTSSVVKSGDKTQLGQVHMLLLRLTPPSYNSAPLPCQPMG